MDFERADLDATGAETRHACAVCATALDGQYWSAANAMVCGTCAEELRRGPPKKGGFVRALKAAVFGVAFGAVGTAVYAAIIHFAEYELALLTIFIGWLVGQGVRRGAEGRGGLGYQSMAAVLTYVMCMESYAPTLFAGATSGADPLPAPVAAVFAPLLALALPFLGDMNVISLLILAFGIYQGFRGPAAVPIMVAGPFDLRPAEPSPADATADVTDDPAAASTGGSAPTA